MMPSVFSVTIFILQDLQFKSLVTLLKCGCVCFRGGDHRVQLYKVKHLNLIFLIIVQKFGVSKFFAYERNQLFIQQRIAFN